MISATTKSPDALAHFQKGELLLNNIRFSEAADEFAQALKIDPDFALAHAFHGQATPGPDGLEELESAAKASSGLPEAERTLIEGLAAERRGDLASARAAYTKLTQIASGDWRSYFLLGARQLVDQNYADAVQALKKATILNANAGAAQNMLGYAALRQGDADGAAAAFTEYVRILPQEPNPQDSLGEALLGAGKFKDAEAAFTKALELSPKFWNAHEGIAYTKFYSGDWDGGIAALARAKDLAPTRPDKIGLDIETADALAAQKKTAAALHVLDAAEKTEGAKPSDIAFVPVTRAYILIDAGRAKDALAPIAAAVSMADSGQLPPGFSRNLRREALRARVAAETAGADAAAAAKTSASLDQDASSHADDPGARSAMQYGRGQLAMAKADTAGARAHFDQCSPEDDVCRWSAVIAARKAGDDAGASAARDRLLKIYRRDPVSLIIWSRLTPKKTK
jgi:tetratricopeptide (TPR) repeat protein